MGEPKGAKKKPTGRPSSYSDELADLLCERLSDGESLRAICTSEDMPAKSTVFKWLREVDGFSDQYALAREAQADALADDILSIADDGRNDWIEKLDKEGEPTGSYAFNREAVQRSSLRVDSRKWLAAKLKPKKYGDKTQLTNGDGDGPVQVVFSTDDAKVL
tara:strand:+ start:94 stop:579 length:486 start_codon:yes stop_codon:yes gene_type:complete